MDVAAAIALGFAAGVLAGMLGVGGGLLFVPALSLALGLSHIDATGTSLAAIVPVAIVGAARQRAYGNIRLGEGLLLGTLAAGGAVAGSAIAEAASEEVLELAFAGLLVVTAAQLVRKALRDDGDPPQ